MYITIFLIKELWQVWQKAMTMVQVMDGKQDSNATHHLSELVPVFRRVGDAHIGDMVLWLW